ncbi:MAG TPA: hypothetical protein VF458_06960, partial [Ktedonobacteraceae bacterium]
PVEANKDDRWAVEPPNDHPCLLQQELASRSAVSQSILENVFYRERDDALLLEDARNCHLRSMEHLRYHRGCLYVSFCKKRN